MIRKEAFINKIRKLGYTYKNQQKRTQLWRKKGGVHRMFVSLSDLLEEDYVRSNLAQAGLKEPEIESFIASAKS